MDKRTKVTLSFEEHCALSKALDSLSEILKTAKVKHPAYALHLSDMKEAVERVLLVANTEDEVANSDIVFACACLYGEEENTTSCRALRHRLEKDVFGKTVIMGGRRKWLKNLQ